MMDHSVDVRVATIGSAYSSLIRNSVVRALGIAAKHLSRGIALPAGTPKEIADVWSAAMKKAIVSEVTKKKMAESGMMIRHMGPEEFPKFWD